MKRYGRTCKDRRVSCETCGVQFMAESAERRFCSKSCANSREHAPEADRFWQKVDRSGGPEACWPWLAKTPAFRLRERRTVRARHYAWHTAHPGQPLPRYMMTTCSSPTCCNPAHLVGSDRIARGPQKSEREKRLTKERAKQRRNLRSCRNCGVEFQATRHMRGCCSVECRFWLRVAKSDGGCWIWTGASHPFGYGVFRHSSERGNLHAHRYAYELTHGQPQADMFVMHVCDNPPCCNPDHLRLGTAADNTRDMISKGRHNWHGLELGRTRNLPKEQRSARAHKAWRTRRAKNEEGADDWQRHRAHAEEMR